MARVVIGLALYQGAEHIAAQLDSIAAQTHSDWRLIVSDDGSRDDGPEIVRRFATARPSGQVKIVNGPCAGATCNFLSLIAQAQDGEYLAFADQDDVWRDDKLEHSLDMLSRHPGAGLYSARTTICDEALNPITGSMRFPGPFTFRNALVQAVTGGNTCVLTPQAVAIACRAAETASALSLESHDWWLYQIISGAGMKVLRDDVEVLLYRQHGDNLIGRNDTFAAMRFRLGQLFEGEYGGWLRMNAEALRLAEDELTKENRQLLSAFSHALAQPGWKMAAQFARLGIRRQTWPGTIALYTAAIMGRLSRG
ncbi:glycosyltransferase [Paracoccus aerodenitrificans]|uniref:glycosyltransferase n=1 Tax=Paracoccus aerodenitrificans TaxID=3017781 RepID=UPI0022F0D5A9|nr:glycosyltransferase [Paracoccus aerodenitrificans]WBU63271.1 glycosyltransferase [Paracoccus aerodenitrificans]